MPRESLLMHQGIAHLLQAKLCRALPFCLIDCSAATTGALTIVAKPFGGNDGWVITGINAKDLATPNALDQAVHELYWEIRDALREL